MFNRIRKAAAILLLVTFICMLIPAQAESVDTATLFGTISGDTYENSFIGMGCRLEGWHYYSDKEIEQTNQLAMEAISQELQDLVNTNITVMAAETADSLRNVNIQIRNVKDYVSIYNQYGLQFIAESSLDQFKSSLEATGMSNVQLSTGSLNIGGEDFAYIGGQYVLSGVTLYFRQMWALRGDFLAYITATTIMTDRTDEVFSHFYLLP